MAKPPKAPAPAKNPAPSLAAPPMPRPEYLAMEEWARMRSQAVTASGGAQGNSSQTAMSSGTKGAAALKSQAVISTGRGGRRSTPYAFTEQGVAILSSVLRSQRKAKRPIGFL